MKWRLYRLPGSGKVWHIDSGPGTLVINCLGWHSDVPVIGREHPSAGYIAPEIFYVRAWIEVEGNLFVNDKHIARFMAPTAVFNNGPEKAKVVDVSAELSELPECELERLTRPDEFKTEVN